jgi:two-component system cell cycle response regulator
MSARILVVDDNPLNVKLLAAKLANEYYIVSSAATGTEALDKVMREKPDIVLLDVMMPEIDGFETCRRIKTDPATAHIPVVMVTALSDVADRVKGLEAGADDFLTKPINDLALMARVRSLLRLKMIMDEWRLRETTSSQFLQPMESETEIPATRGGHVVLLEDNGLQRELIVRTLSKIEARVTLAATVAEATTLAQEGNCDLAIASLDLATEDGLQICPQLRTHETTRQMPILLIANETETPRVAKGLDLGANDYLLRPIDSNELLARTRTQLKQRRHYVRMRSNYEQNMSLALVDPLTGAFNRRYLEAHAPKLLARCRMVSKPLAIGMIDLDYFKQVNDRYGHAAGDTVLKEIVNRITQGLRPFDLVARMGGEEFVIIMPETGIGAATAIGERLRERIGQMPIAWSEKAAPLPVTVSIGIAIGQPDENVTVDAIIARADRALYEAKKAGRNCVMLDKGEETKNG